MRNSKVCFKCNVDQPLENFYKHSGMADGRLNKCIFCAKKDAIETRNKNLDYYLEYDRSRSNKPERIKARESYSKTEKGMAAHRKAKEKWVESNVIKRSASIIVGNAVRDGKLIKPSFCSCCGNTNKVLHGHHDDYAYPLSVRWLCSKCHTAWHKENGSGLNG